MLEYDYMDKFLINLTKQGGDYLLKNFKKDGKLVRMRKTAKEAATKYDKENDQLIIEKIREKHPKHSILTEESGFIDNESDWLWIVDSLDGTSNFANSNPLFSICIALMHKKALKLGAIYAPAIDEFYFAKKDRGAYLNGDKIKISTTKTLDQSYLFYCEGGETNRKRIAQNLKKIYPEVTDLKKIGSAGIETAWVAAGRGDGYFTTKIDPWDVAAGVLLVREAGGKVTDFKGGTWKPEKSDLVFSNKKVHQEILGLIK